MRRGGDKETRRQGEFDGGGVLLVPLFSSTLLWQSPPRRVYNQRYLDVGTMDVVRGIAAASVPVFFSSGAVTQSVCVGGRCDGLRSSVHDSHARSVSHRGSLGRRCRGTPGNVWRMLALGRGAPPSTGSFSG